MFLAGMKGCRSLCHIGTDTEKLSKNSESVQKSAFFFPQEGGIEPSNRQEHGQIGHLTLPFLWLVEFLDRL
jgi:hypothetical protein